MKFNLPLESVLQHTVRYNIQQQQKNSLLLHENSLLESLKKLTFSMFTDVEHQQYHRFERDNATKKKHTHKI